MIRFVTEGAADHGGTLVSFQPHRPGIPDTIPGSMAETFSTSQTPRVIHAP